METHKMLEEWIIKMGYDGNVPCLKGICNPSTEFIWQQIMDKVKPIAEIEFMRRNIIINRLKRKSDVSDINDTFVQIPIPEIEAWKKKKELKAKINEIKREIQLNNIEIEENNIQNKMSYIKLQGIKKRTKEIDEKTFLFAEKSTNLEVEVNRAEEMLTLIKTLTPIESTDLTNKEKVTQTLQECSKQLKEYVANQAKIYLNNSSTDSNSQITFTVPKPIDIFVTRRQQRFAHSSCSTSSRLFTVKKASSLDKTYCQRKINDTHYDFNALDMIKDNKFGKIAEELLKNNNRLIVFNLMRANDKKYFKQLSEALLNYDDLFGKPIEFNKQHHQVKLYAKYLEYELKNVKSHLICSKLREEIQKIQNQTLQNLLSQYRSSNQINGIQNILKLQQKDIGLSAAITCALQNLRKLEENTEGSEELMYIQRKLKNVEDSMNNVLENIRNQIFIFNKVLIQMCKTRNEINALAKNQQQFTMNLNWATPLLSNLISSEIEIFGDFPLEFNRHAINSKKKCTSLDSGLYSDQNKDWDNNSLRIISSSFDRIYSPPETILLTLVQEKNKLETFKILKNETELNDIKRYDYNELKSRDANVKKVITKLDSIIHSEISKKNINFPKYLEETMKMWVEMPFKDYISSNRLVEGHSFQYYEKQFCDLYKNL